jgi:D-proline reductase (dithiol) PrdB
MPEFDPPTLVPLRKPVAESTIGMFVSCGAQLPEDPLLLETEDITFRLLPRDTPTDRLVVSHQTLVRKWALEDLNVAYPIDRMKELEREGTFKIIARALEARGLPTISTSVLWEMSAAVKPPRTCFLDFPLGCPAGKPHAAAQQRDILRRTLQLAAEFDPDNWAMKSLPFQWDVDGNRDWENATEELYRGGGIKITDRHMAAHASIGESLLGNERAFAIKCNC